ncbi:MAG: proton-conducting transporter membrane subunit [Candidatus Omnitrophota bacterium]
MKQIFLPIVTPLAAALLVLCAPKKSNRMKEALALAGAAVNLFVAASLFNKNVNFSAPWLGFGIDLSLRADLLAGFILIAAAGFGFLVTLYSLAFMSDKASAKQFYFYLLVTLCLVNGAVLAENLFLMLFFWEGLLLTLFGMIAIGGKDSYKTAIKAFTIVGVSDLCMMIGIALTAHLAGTLAMSKISLSFTPMAGLAFTLLMIGALAKAGAMPFHSWIPDASLASPLPFMAFLPAALEKLLGIYFLARISLDMFRLSPGAWPSAMLMIIGSATILLAVMMALIQKDYKKLLSYHAISQVGYMVLGIGTALPAGIIGGLFHMINHAMYKSCLFLTAGSVEKEAGSTDLEKLGGIGLKMPVTFACFLIAAMSISGVPPFNGFFSKELLYGAALERGLVFYAAAALGSFFTALSFLKLGHAVYLGRIREENKNVKEAPWGMLFPMIALAAGCVIFGLWNKFPIHNIIQPIVAGEFSESMNAKIILATVIILCAALIHHLVSVKLRKRAINAVDNIHHAPMLSVIYDKAEKRHFDPYDIGLKAVSVFVWSAFLLDRMNDFIYNRLAPGCLGLAGRFISRSHSGNFATYIGWSILGMLIIVIFLMRGL